MDTLETWTDFVKGERVGGKRTRRITCTCCEARDSDPKHDAFSFTTEGGRSVPSYWCGPCFAEHIGEGDGR